MPWKTPSSAAAPTVSTSNGVRRLAFSLKPGESLKYVPAGAGCPTNGTAEVVVSNALLHVAAALPATANPDHQASITAAKPAGAGEKVPSPLPGVIIEISVKEGQQVKQGQKVVILEAMKMENEIPAPKDGTITEIHVHKGDTLQEGDPVVTIA